MKTCKGFPAFAQTVAKSFQQIASGPNVFLANVDGDALYEAYLAAFPEGTNPLFKTRTEHDCSCCKHFIRRVGAVVKVENGVVSTIWDAAAESNTIAPHHRTVSAALRDIVRDADIRDLFRVGLSEAAFGAEVSHSLDAESGNALTWNHFYTGPIPRALRSHTPEAVCGDYRTTLQVFQRGLVELSDDAIETVLSLIQSNALYRGEEHKGAVVGFRSLHRAYADADPYAQGLFVWEHASSPAARFRNTVIGTLVQDLSEGEDLERAVKSFETKVAPQNYKRTTALITPGMVKKAMQTLEELGLEPALERRFATIKDVSVNDVKWVDGSVRSKMKGGIADVLLRHATASSPAKEERAEDITLDDFMTRVLPEATSLELLFSGALLGNLMSLTAPVHPEPKQLFRWTNDFAWSYGGNVADSIKERVKKAGGKVEGTLRVSLSWFNYDDLDLHVFEPLRPSSGGYYTGGHIYYANRRGTSGGQLDVDMNAGHGTTREAVENVIWPSHVPDGTYRVEVHNYCFRENSDPGFTIEIECGGKVSHFSYSRQVRHQNSIAVVNLTMKDGAIAKMEVCDPAITTQAVSQEKWGLRTEQYVKVAAVMLSPNHWGNNAVGNKHTFFVIEGAKNDEATRGFYNEFLHPRLEPHRKVFEIIADKTKCQPTEEQLSGLGFSSTKKDTFVARVKQGNRQRVFNVNV